MKKTKPNKPKPDLCEAKGCGKEPVTVLGGYWFCAEHGNRDYEKREPSSVDSPSAGSVPSVRDQLFDVWKNETQTRAMCAKEGFTTNEQINACWRVIVATCDLLEKEQND